MVLQQQAAGADLAHLAGNLEVVDRAREEVGPLWIRVDVQIDHAIQDRIMPHLRRGRTRLRQAGERRSGTNGERPG
jgi:hypothetical protein